jgi:hypothetical protein
MADIAAIREATVERVRRHRGVRCLTIEIHERAMPSSGTACSIAMRATLPVSRSAISRSPTNSAIL